MTLLERRRALMSQTGEKYVFVEYLESTGQEWIDTGIIANGDTKVDVDFQITTISASFMFGSRVNSTTKAYSLNVNGASNIISPYGDGGAYALGTADTLRHTVNKNGRVLYYDGNIIASYTAQTFTTPGTLELFACDNNGTKGYLPSKMKLYSCQIYDGVLEGERTLLRDFVPCYRKSDKAGGLYDLVSGTFFENQGTGEFLIGGEV